MINFDQAKKNMIENQFRARGITNERILNVFNEVDRQLFVREENLEQSYEDTALPIGEGQTISQPYMVALMIELLYPTEKEIILEIGTGSGYEAALLSKLSRFVVSMERNKTLAVNAREKLKKLKIENTSIICGDGTLGWKENAPYDGIIVSAGAPSVPKALIDQLKVGGRLIIPVENKKYGGHTLQLILKEEDDIYAKNIIDCGFVPLIGRGI